MTALTVPIALLASTGHADPAGQLGGPNLLFLLLVFLPFVVGGALVLRSRDAAISTVVLFSAAAGFIHAMVTPEHFLEHPAVGLFFLAVTLGQMAVVLAGLNRPSRPLWVATVAGNAAVLAVWAMSRTTGLPVGPEAWAPEPVGLLDLAAAAYEVAIITGGLALAAKGGLLARYSRPKAVVRTSAALFNL